MEASGDNSVPPHTHPRVSKMALSSIIQRGYVGEKGSDFESLSQEDWEDCFETYRSCVLTLHNVQEWLLLRERLDLRLMELIKSTYGDIFPPKVFLAQSNEPRLGSILKR